MTDSSSFSHWHSQRTAKNGHITQTYSYIYKDGKKITEYNGKRGLDELDAFVKEHSGAKKDEL